MTTMQPKWLAHNTYVYCFKMQTIIAHSQEDNIAYDFLACIVSDILVNVTTNSTVDVQFILNTELNK